MPRRRQTQERRCVHHWKQFLLPSHMSANPHRRILPNFFFYTLVLKHRRQTIGFIMERGQEWLVVSFRHLLLLYLRPLYLLYKAHWRQKGSFQWIQGSYMLTFRGSKDKMAKPPPPHPRVKTFSSWFQHACCKTHWGRDRKSIWRVGCQKKQIKTGKGVALNH